MLLMKYQLKIVKFLNKEGIFIDILINNAAYNPSNEKFKNFIRKL